VPYARKLIDIHLLAPQEIQWINDYHHDIYHFIVEDLPSEVREWLKEATAPL